MTRYGFAIKALPKSSKPFGDDDEDQDQDAAAGESTDAGASSDAADPSADPAGEPAEDIPDAETETEPESDAETAAEEVPDASAESPTDDAEIPEGGSAGDAPPAPEDDARPWSGDMYDEGDETDPAAAFAAYKGANGEEAWLDQAPDGTLTGWVRDATGQVWRYTDPDVWAIDVDDARMTRTHSQANGGSEGAPAEHGGQDPLFPPKQS
ncbi:hypothetical protein [Streptomyces lunaelactis]|uniref:hypothetical protein n=1 Tax=Streptomyces lunaelactis TaxID=1535768 RepID=UPI0015854645|nr:hypothetical protein [Streptomyces lunaelactis]NUL21838.1 hypothetical protein [Streptomyces lunaelactis]